MRSMLSGLAAGLAGAVILAGAAQAQPYGYYRGFGDYGYRYSPPRSYGYDGRYTPYSYSNGYDGYRGYQGYGGNSYYGYGGSALGSLGGGGAYGYGLGHPPYDEYGPDPNGMIAPDGHRIKCKVMNSYDEYSGDYVTRRQCW